MPMQERVSLEWDRWIQDDINGFFIGKRLGSGLSREVFVFQQDPRWVVKIETGFERQNMLEQMVWMAVKGTKWEPWFAEIRSVSGECRVVLQKRVYLPPKGQTFPPKKLPSIFSDVRECNWGWLRGRWVCFDYAFTNSITQAVAKTKMVDAKTLQRFGAR